MESISCTLAPMAWSMPGGNSYVIPLLFHCIFIFPSKVLIFIVNFNEIFVQCWHWWSTMQHSILPSTLHGMSWGGSCSRFPLTGTGVKKKSGASYCHRWHDFLVAQSICKLAINFEVIVSHAMRHIVSLPWVFFLWHWWTHKFLMQALLLVNAQCVISHLLGEEPFKDKKWQHLCPWSHDGE